MSSAVIVKVKCIFMAHLKQRMLTKVLHNEDQHRETWQKWFFVPFGSLGVRIDVCPTKIPDGFTLLYEMFKNIMHNGRRHTFVWFHNVCVPDMCALWELLSSYICSSSISVKASLQITGASCRDHHSLTFWSHMLTFDGSFCLILGIFALVCLSGWKWTLHFTAVFQLLPWEMFSWWSAEADEDKMIYFWKLFETTDVAQACVCSLAGWWGEFTKLSCH